MLLNLELLLVLLSSHVLFSFARHAAVRIFVLHSSFLHDFFVLDRDVAVDVAVEGLVRCQLPYVDLGECILELGRSLQFFLRTIGSFLRAPLS